MLEREFTRTWTWILIAALAFSVLLLAREWSGSRTDLVILVTRVLECLLFVGLAILILVNHRAFARHKFPILFASAVAVTITMISLTRAQNDFYYVWGTIQILSAVVLFGELTTGQTLVICLATFALQAGSVILFKGPPRGIITMLVFGVILVLGRRFSERRINFERASLRNIRLATARARHDMQQPMSALNRWIYNLEQSRSEPDRVAVCISHVRKVLSHVTYIVNEVLELSRSNQEAMQITSWGDVRLDELLTAIERVMGQEPSVQNETGRRLNEIVLHGEFDPVLRAVLNLTVNARRHSSDGRYRVRISAPTEGQVEIRVINRIDPENPPPPSLTVADPAFDRASFQIGQTRGLGLGIVHETMRALGGTSGHVIQDGCVEGFVRFQSSQRVAG